MRGDFHICSERGLCLRFSCVFLQDVATHWVQCVFSSLLFTIVGFLWSVPSRCCHPFFGSGDSVPTSSVGSSDLLVAGGCALVLLVVLIFDSGLSPPGLLCCYARSLRFVRLAVRWLSAHRLLGYRVHCPLSFPSLSSLLWVCRFLWVLFSHMVRILRDRVTPAGSRLVRSSTGTKDCSAPHSIMG